MIKRLSWPGLGLLLILAGCAATPRLAPVPAAPAAHAPATAEPPEPVASEAQVMAAVDAGNSVFFSRGSSQIDAAGEQTLQSHARRLKAEPKLQVRLTGYTDDQGSRSYNLAMSEQRVNAVYQLLRRYGVPARQLHRSSVGEEKTSRHCNSAECRQKMRRVELVYPQ